MRYRRFDAARHAFIAEDDKPVGDTLIFIEKGEASPAPPSIAARDAVVTLRTARISHAERNHID